MAAKIEQRLIAFIVFLVHPIQLQDVCQYQYEVQPPKQLQCNPYVNGLTLDCVVEAPVTTAFSVDFYRMSSSQLSPQQLQPSERRTGFTADVPGEGRHASSRIRISFSAGNAELEDTPTFWCQINENGTLLEPSQKLFLQTHNFYSGNDLGACFLTDDQSVELESCADLTPSPPQLPVSAPPPAPTPSSSPPLVPPGEDDQSDDGDDGDSVDTTLLSVGVLIAVLFIAVVALTVAIVILYCKRKCYTHVDTKQPDGVQSTAPTLQLDTTSSTDNQLNQSFTQELMTCPPAAGEEHGNYQRLCTDTVDYLSMYSLVEKSIAVPNTGPPSGSGRPQEHLPSRSTKAAGNYQSLTPGTKDKESKYTMVTPQKSPSSRDK